MEHGNIKEEMRNRDGVFMLENQNTEWKQSWRDEYLKWICGFANAQGGKFILEQRMTVLLLV